jgi:hypothetical protein
MYNKAEHFQVSHIEKRNNREVKVGQFYCILNGNTYTTLRALANNVRSFGITVQDYYDKYYKADKEGVCAYCNIPTSFESLIDGYRETCTPCHCKTDAHRNKVKNRFHDVEVLESFRSKRKVWFESLTEDEKIRMSEQRVDTLKKVHGADYFNRFGKAGNDSLKRRCALYPGLRKQAVARMLETKRRNNTFRSNMSGRISKLEYKDREYSFQGYEDLLIKFLVDKEVRFVCFYDVPQVTFECASGTYKPDFFLPDYNLLIDVKSERTITMKPEKLFAKQNAVFDAGYNFFYYVIDSRSFNKQRFLCEEDQGCFLEALNMLISSQASKEEGSTTIPRGSTLQAIGSGSARTPVIGV